MKNYAYKLAGEFVARIFSTLFLLVLARIVGAAEFGVYATAFAFASIFMPLVDLGTNSILTREIARYPDKRPHIIASVNFLKCLTSLVMLVCLWIATRALHIAPEKSRLILWLGLSVVGTAFTDYLGAIFTGMEQMRTEAILKVINKSTVMIITLMVLLHTRSLLPTVRAMGLISIISLMISALLTRVQLGRFGFAIDGPYLKKLLMQSLPILGSMAFLILYDSQDILILSYYKIANRDIGLFALAAKFIDVLKIFPVFLANTYFPSLARHAQLSQVAFRSRVKELMRNALIGLPLITILTYALAPLLIQTLYGKSFLEAVPVLRLLLIGFFVMAFNALFLQILIALDREKISFLGSAVVCFCNLAFNALLVPHYGIIGTCYALIASEILYLCFQSYLLKSTPLTPKDQRPIGTVLP